ncbi:MAG: GNAT family N-acetyltransferase [Microlunatus sp.]|nr:GNAT family N-acetyltransferase [Microlunatus sp.]MDN5804281.1 GNAT family N-acetyltransferase [Microlunatus sp.]
MSTMAEVWPPYRLRLRAGDLSLSVVGDDDIPGLVELALAGIHDPDTMPFLTPWTLQPRDEMPAEMVRYFSSVRATFSAEAFDLLFAVRVAGVLVGVQGLYTRDFAVVRTAETGSWLGRAYQGHGIGTRMRRAVCAFAFDELGAQEVTSAAFVDNPASMAVSRKVGYRPNGVVRLKRRESEMALNQKLVLSPADLVRGDPLEVSGAKDLQAFLGLGAGTAAR